MKILILILIPLALFGCKENAKNNTVIVKTTKMSQNETLISGIGVENNLLFDKNDIDLKTFKYNEVYIENIKISDLLDIQYRNGFIKYLEDVKNENDQFKSSLLCKLLLMRIAQLSDTNSFYILSEVSKNESVSYNGIELYENLLTELFLQDPHFFVQQSVIYKDSSLVDYIITILPQYLIDEDFLEMNLGFVKSNVNNEGALLIRPESEKIITYLPLLNKLKTIPKIEVQLGPSFYTGFETENLYFKNVMPLFGGNLLNKFNSTEKDLYEKKILPVLEKKIIERKFEVGTIQDLDGYTNLRKEKSSSSEILQKIKSGERIDVLNNSGEWWQIKTKEGKMGYVHKSRIKSGISNSHLTSFLLYDRPDFSSFSKEIAATNDIEIVHQKLGMGFCKNKWDVRLFTNGRK